VYFIKKNSKVISPKTHEPISYHSTYAYHVEVEANTFEKGACTVLLGGIA